MGRRWPKGLCEPIGTSRPPNQPSAVCAPWRIILRPSVNHTMSGTFYVAHPGAPGKLIRHVSRVVFKSAVASLFLEF
jgi:hypothetical protein